MKIKFLKTVLFIAFVFIADNLLAQEKSIEIKGIVVESTGQQPIGFATVMVANKETQQPITGVTTEPDGSFSVKTDSPNFYVEISFIGFTTKKNRRNFH